MKDFSRRLENNFVIDDICEALGHFFWRPPARGSRERAFKMFAYWCIHCV